MKTKVVFLGGYLGAGKTTLAFHLARALHEQGKSVSVVLNDQGNVLVDTQFMKNAGVDVAEVIGACFCTKFDEFVKNARSLVAMGRPDVILAEPIGTSTSLMSSVIAPMKSLYKDEFHVSPLFVVVDGPRASGEMGQGESLGLAARKMIPIHQMHEAEIMVISKTDLMTDDERKELVGRLSAQVPDAKVIEFSSMDLRNMVSILEVINSDRETSKLVSSVDQRAFRAEKSSMGWYSANCKLTSANDKVDVYNLLTDIMKGIARRFKTEDVAHVKVLLSSPKASAKISLVEGSIQIDDLKGGRYFMGEGEFILNSRVRSPPKPLQLGIDEILEAVFSKAGVSVTDKKVACFAPKPDAPKHIS